MARSRHPRRPTAALPPLEIWSIDAGRCGPALLALEANEPRLPAAHAAALLARPERAVVHIALRLLLERRLGESLDRRPFTVSASGRPSLPEAPLDFNLSHCNGMALVAIGPGGPIGVDIEPVDRELGTLQSRAGRIEAAARTLASGRPLPGSGTSRLLAAWVRIEAFAKADGAGVAALLSRLGIIGTRISDADAAARAAGVAAHSPKLVLDDIEVAPDFVAAIARQPCGNLPLLDTFPSTRDAIAALVGHDRH